jgi:hypothetical protein
MISTPRSAAAAIRSAVERAPGGRADDDRVVRQVRRESPG